MTQDIKLKAKAASQSVLRPFARFALKAKIGVGEFISLVKQAYVFEVAEQHKASGRRRPNITRIANQTGLTRKDVKDILAELSGDARSTQRGSVRAQRTLDGWWTPAFVDRKTRRPRRLKYLGPHPSFQSLVERHSGDRQHASILDELVASNAARRLEDGSVEVLSRTCYSNVVWDEDALDIVRVGLAQCFETLLYNLQNPHDPRFAQYVMGRLDADAATVVIPELASHAATFLEGAKETITHEKHAPQSRRARQRAIDFGVALIFLQNPDRSPQERPAARDAALVRTDRSRKRKRQTDVDAPGTD